MRFGVTGCSIILLSLLGAGCKEQEDTPTIVDPAVDPGALIRMDLTSTVGVLLDEIPEGPVREAAAAEMLAQNDSFWLGRASRQTKLTYYRLNFRKYYYEPGTRGPLSLPLQEEIWNVVLTGKPERVTSDGHDAVVVDYSFNTHLLTDLASPAIADPNLEAVGGTTQEAFNLPLDPELLKERTGYACMDEAAYPLYSVFEENVRYFYDDLCGVEVQGSPGCHYTESPKESCVEALQKHTGIVPTSMQFTRVAWDDEIATSVRVGEPKVQKGAALSVIEEEMEREQAYFYRFFEPDACELEEKVIAKTGWRRLLAFSAKVMNEGIDALDVGNVVDPESPYRKSNVYESSQCHGHVHFSHYANFDYAGAPGGKRAFCVEDTDRTHNNETTPLFPLHQSCQFQGMTPGWGDDYQYGIPGQWVDITDVDATKPYELRFELNPEGFLCEGTPVLDASGEPIFEPTAFTNAEGKPVSRAKCDAPANWKDDNVGTVMASSAGGSFVTEPCTRGQIGPLRSCGFDMNAILKDCVPGAEVKLQCQSTGAARIVRICERSEALGGVACAVGDSIANAIVDEAGTAVTFVCPAVRDAVAPPIGGYSLYGAPVLPSQSASSMVCTGG